MYPGVHAAVDPDKPAVVLDGADRVLTYGDLEDRSVRLAHVLRGAGLVVGDTVAMLATNDPRVFEVYWACLRSGLYLTAVNTHLSVSEAAYIVEDCDAKVLIASADLAALAVAVAAEVPVGLRLAWEGDTEGSGDMSGFGDYDEALAATSSDVPADQPRGADMLYSSGTTGRPKGVKPPLPPRQVGDPGDTMVAVFGSSYEFGPDTVYYSPAPLYHAAPLRFGMVTQALGGTVVTAKRFDAEAALRALEHHRVTHSQWVPTHFVRMLRLPDEVRRRYDVSAQRYVVHAAAPCPVEVKRAMIEWWGPILQEYYSSTEANGVCMIDSAEWLAKPGSVGRAKLGVLRICDDAGDEVPPGVDGLVYFERDELPFGYHKDPDKTRSVQHPTHPTWTTCGDIGHVDEDGYLFLTDRKAFMIISGGVNIYPQEIEDSLILHPDVLDVAVIGVPDPEMGEAVLAVVQPAAHVTPGQEVAERLLAHVRGRLAGFKVPRRVEFVDELPRTATGKLVKGRLRGRFAPPS